MLKGFKDLCKTPVTWGAYFVLCGVSMLITMITIAIKLEVFPYLLDMLGEKTKMSKYLKIKTEPDDEDW